MNREKKFTILFLVIILITSFFVYLQIKKNTEINNQPEKKSIIEDSSLNIPMNTKDALLGNPGAPFTLVEFLNFANCNNRCKEIHNTIVKFVKKNPMQIRLIFKHAPSTAIFTDSNKLSHVTGICVNEQNKLFDYIDNIFQEKKLKENNIYDALDKTGVSKKEISECLEEDWPYEYMENSYSFYKSANLKDNPVIFINNKKINLYKDIDIQELLDKIVYGTNN